MKCPYQINIDCRYVNTATMEKEVSCTECELFDTKVTLKRKSTRYTKNIMFLVAFTLLILIMLLCSCTRQIAAQKSYSFSHSAYGNIYYAPYHKHSPRWYKRKSMYYHYHAHPIKRNKLPKPK